MFFGRIPAFAIRTSRGQGGHDREYLCSAGRMRVIETFDGPLSRPFWVIFDRLAMSAGDVRSDTGVFDSSCPRTR
jgi:hypothetical protein